MCVRACVCACVCTHVDSAPSSPSRSPAVFVFVFGCVFFLGGVSLCVCARALWLNHTLRSQSQVSGPGPLSIE